MAKTSGREQPELAAALAKMAAPAASTSALTDELKQQMVTDVMQHGDPIRGESIFRRDDVQCLKCHAIAGAGGQAGPDLISIGASAQVDYLIDSLLDPNKQVKEGFHSLVVATSDGRILTGINARRTDSELILRNAEDQDVAIPLNTIEEQKTGGSIMPAGLTDPLTRGELLDLMRFLSLLGKSDGAFAVGQARVARRWQVLDATGATAQEIRHKGLQTAAGETRYRWTPAYSCVSGDLPLDFLHGIKFPYQGTNTAIVRFQLDVTTPGEIKLRLNSDAGIRAWYNQNAIETAHEMTLKATAGRHTITLAVNLDERKDGLRCELLDHPDSSAQAQFVLGK
jgi:putative heme-binding domain-containing protein